MENYVYRYTDTSQISTDPFFPNTYYLRNEKYYFYLSLLYFLHSRLFPPTTSFRNETLALLFQMPICLPSLASSTMIPPENRLSYPAFCQLKVIAAFALIHHIAKSLDHPENSDPNQSSSGIGSFWRVFHVGETNKQANKLVLLLLDRVCTGSQLRIMLTVSFVLLQVVYWSTELKRLWHSKERIPK